MLRRIRAKQRFLHRTADAHERAPSSRVQLSIPGQTHLFLDEMSQCQIQIIPAQNQMIPHRDAMKMYFAISGSKGANQREIARSTADVAHQDFLSGSHLRFPTLFLIVQPCVKSRLRFFNKHDLPQPRLHGRFHRQLPGHFIKRCRHGQDHILLRERMIRKLKIPGIAEMREITAAHRNRGQTLHIRRTMPRKQARRAIDTRMTKP